MYNEITVNKCGGCPFDNVAIGWDDCVCGLANALGEKNLYTEPELVHKECPLRNIGTLVSLNGSLYE